MGLLSKLFGGGSSGRQPEHLFAAIKANDLARVKQACESGVPVDSQLGSALSYAVAMSTPEITQYLLTRPCDVNYVVEGSLPSLVAASAKRRTEFFGILLDKGADMEGVGKIDPPLTALAFSAVRDNLEGMQILLTRGAKADTPVAQPGSVHEDRGHTPLTWVSNAGNVEAARLLIEHGANVNHLTNAGVTAVFMAAFAGHTDVVRLLIQHGAMVDMASARSLQAGMIAPFAALSRGHRECYEVIRPKSMVFREMSFDEAKAKYRIP